MSDKDRRKKDGQDKNKKNQAMREDVARRHEQAGPPDTQTDPAEQQFQQGSNRDNSRANQGA
jgi:hypothetical protein